jgi:hypothetical protein
MDITPELLRDISVRAVEDFLNNKTPLSLGLAKQAAAHDLNVEQVKRAVESTNNIAYLKILQVAEDRTVEFPLAKFAEVMEAATVPINFQEKTATATLIGVEPVSLASIEKIASAYELVKNEEYTFLIKMAASNNSALERLEIESITMADNLIKAAKTLKKDDAWMDKLASVTDQSSFAELSYLVSGSVQKYRDLTDLGLFKESQLKEVSSFANLYKQARELVREQRERTELKKQADDTTSGIKSNIFSRATQKLVGAPGYAAGAAAGAAASIPFRAAHATGKATVGSIKNTFTGARQEGGGVASSVGKAVGKTGGSLGKAVMGFGGPALDAAFYDPGVDKSTGRSNDAWTALQRD